jgi:cholesterol transport system auxiliary component
MVGAEEQTLKRPRCDWGAGRTAPFVSVGTLAALTLCLAACAGSVFGPDPVPTFDLTAPRLVHAETAARGQLVVSEPSALSILDSDRIVVRSAGDQVAHLANAQWSDRLPRLLQSRLVEALENAGHARPVGTPDDRFSADYQLVTELRAFEISVVSVPVAQVEIAAKVVTDRGGKILASRVFRASVPARSSSGPDAVAALDEAFQQVATALVQWAGHFV